MILGWVIFALGAVLSVSLVRIGRRKFEDDNGIVVGVALAIYFSLAMVGMSIAFDSLSEGFGDALVSMIVSVPIIVISSRGP